MKKNGKNGIRYKNKNNICKVNQTAELIEDEAGVSFVGLFD